MAGNQPSSDPEPAEARGVVASSNAERFDEPVNSVREVAASSTARAASSPVTAGPPPYSEDELAARGLQRDRLPRHVAFIMDGNGRWAGLRGWPRTEGHRHGAETVEFLVEECARLGLDQITLYCFSRENWKRPEAEQAFLFALLREYIVAQRPRIVRQRLRFATIGDLEPLPAEVRQELATTREVAATHSGMRLCLALNYGSRQEIAAGVRQLAGEVARGERSVESIDERAIDESLDTAGMHDPDLVVRTSGEWRLSNFMLWQLSYAELWVTDTHWPDFRREELDAALLDYGRRQRRFGGLADESNVPRHGVAE